MPPIDGLQDIWPSVSMLCVSSSVLRAHARGGERGLGAGVAAADDDDVEMLREVHDFASEISVLRRRPRTTPHSTAGRPKTALFHVEAPAAFHVNPTVLEVPREYSGRCWQ